MQSKLYQFVFLAFALIPLMIFAQEDQPTSFGKGSAMYTHSREFEVEKSLVFNPDLAPFFHGVASGDPLEDRVIIWTRVTPDSMSTDDVDVAWKMATDSELTDVVASGTLTTGMDRDYTVKVDVTGLEAGQTYYYGFTAMGANSLTGKTKTTPTGDQADHLKFGVVSCSNFQAGYFNAYGRLAARTDLDAIVHLGDYIYEYDNFIYGDSSVWEERLVEPGAEIISLFDYRARYSTYRLDTNLIRLHQQHPIISVWDDHESANDSYVDGAENHTEGEEGEWETRKAISKQVYFEWMPIRDNEEQQVYRTLSYGNLADLIMLDTRLEGREQQITSILDTALFAPDRTLLGVDQKAWFLQQLLNSTAKWKVIGQQVIFSEFNVGWAGSAVGATFEDTESLFLDIWDGYPAERAQIVSFLSDNDVDNVVFLTGDFHSSFAFDVGLPSVDLVFQDIPGVGTVPFYNQSPTYDPATGDGSVAVEFATPSINSANFDENAGFVVAVGLQAQINAPIITGGIDLGNPNPHMKYAELIQHGYYILDIKGDSTQANYYYTPILEVTNDELFAAGYYTLDAENHLNAAAGPSEPKEIQDTPAPLDPPPFTSSTRNVLENLRVLAVYPNPAKDIVDLQYALNAPSRVRVELLDANGRALRTLRDERLGTGLYTLRAPVLDLPAGTYFLRLSTSEGQISQVILKK